MVKFTATKSFRVCPETWDECTFEEVECMCGFFEEWIMLNEEDMTSDEWDRANTMLRVWKRYIKRRGER